MPRMAVPLDGDTVFEIGSITKVFTALLLTEMVTRGEVALDDPASKYLPGHVKMPERNGKKITLLDLADLHLRPAAASRRNIVQRR